MMVWEEQVKCVKTKNCRTFFVWLSWFLHSEKGGRRRGEERKGEAKSREERGRRDKRGEESTGERTKRRRGEE
jgi:hypothetical protein